MSGASARSLQDLSCAEYRQAKPEFSVRAKLTSRSRGGQARFAMRLSSTVTPVFAEDVANDLIAPDAQGGKLAVAHIK